jgi:hypothetical protein
MRPPNTKLGHREKVLPHAVKGDESMPLTKCPTCARDVSTEAVACPHCGHPFKASIPQAQRKWSPGVAAVLSLVIPGAGQMYKGQIFNGLLWLVLVVLGYVFFVVPGIILHLFCIIGASMGDPTK